MGKVSSNDRVKKSKKPEVASIAKDLDTYNALDALVISEGGKILCKNLMTDAVSSIDVLINGYDSFELSKFISLCADIKTKLDMLRILRRAPKNRKYLRESLEEALENEDAEEGG